MVVPNKKLNEVDLNKDPITGEHGSHPTGTGLGAVAGGAATGVVAGAVAGPIGAAIGAAVGAVAGGLAGKAIAEEIDPTVEAAYWKNNYRSRNYVDAKIDYQNYEPAYRYGYESKSRYDSNDFSAAELELQRGWENYRGDSILDWGAARPAIEDAWDRVRRNKPTSK